MHTKARRFLRRSLSAGFALLAALAACEDQPAPTGPRARPADSDPLFDEAPPPDTAFLAFSTPWNAADSVVVTYYPDVRAVEVTYSGINTMVRQSNGEVGHFGPCGSYRGGKLGVRNTGPEANVQGYDFDGKRTQVPCTSADSLRPMVVDSTYVGGTVKAVRATGTNDSFCTGTQSSCWRYYAPSPGQMITVRTLDIALDVTASSNFVATAGAVVSFGTHPVPATIKALPPIIGSVHWAWHTRSGQPGQTQPCPDLQRSCNKQVWESGWMVATATVNGVPNKVDSVYVGVGPEPLIVSVLNVGQGDAVLISNGPSRVVIDGGPSRTLFRGYLDANGLRNTTVDAVMMTHTHEDHLPGLAELFLDERNLKIDYIFDDRKPHSNADIKLIRDSIDKRVGRGELVYRNPVDPCGNGEPICTLQLKGGAKVHVMRPYSGSTDENERSIPVKVVAPGADSVSFRMWLAGDAGRQALLWFETMYQFNPGMGVNIMKVNHHGSCTGITNKYMELANSMESVQRVAAISVGAGNRYGHPHSQTKEVLNNGFFQWYRTDLNGTITFRWLPGMPKGVFETLQETGLPNMSTPDDSTATSCPSM